MVFSEKWLEVLTQVGNFRNGESTWYRGVNDVTYNLNSGLFRYDYPDLKGYINREKANYKIFQNLGHLNHSSDGWNLLYIMQHHGAKTRLLDWTESFAVALYFASRGWKVGTKAKIWLLKPIKLNGMTEHGERFVTTNEKLNYEEYFESEGKISFFGNNSFALHPVRSNPRLIAQQGVFTVQGNTLLPLNEEKFNNSTLGENVLTYIELDDSLRKDIHAFLHLSGITHFTLFPDLEGLSMHTNKMYEKNYYFRP